MENIICLNDGMKLISGKELMLTGGRDHILDACAFIGVIAVATGGMIAANPIGSTALGFCAGYALGVRIASWLT